MAGNDRKIENPSLTFRQQAARRSLSFGVRIYETGALQSDIRQLQETLATEPGK